LRRNLGDRYFDKEEFEVITDFLTEARERQTSEAQLQMAQDLGLKKVGLFMEFRQELEKHRDLFRSLDARSTGFLNKDEVWLACTSLGILPRTIREKRTALEIVSKLCFKGTSERDREPYHGLVLGLYSVEHETRDDQLLPDPEHLKINGRMNLERFLEVLSKIRHYDISQLREQLRPLFDRLVRKSRGRSVESVIYVAEISEALECLSLAPTKPEEQDQLLRFLNDVNEWGFNPLTLEFEGFVRFIRLVREWRNYSQREEDCKFAEQQLGYAKRQAHVYQAIFEIVDKQGEGTLDITGIRRAVRLLKRTHITSDELRDLFARTDEDSNGSVSFNEFMQMVFEMEPPARETRKGVFMRASTIALSYQEEEGIGDETESEKALEPLPWDVLSPGDDDESAEPTAEE
jgi:Ca2+-binding EF-hand superfamily protein